MANDVLVLLADRAALLAEHDKYYSKMVDAEAKAESLDEEVKEWNDSRTRQIAALSAERDALKAENERLKNQTITENDTVLVKISEHGRATILTMDAITQKYLNSKQADEDGFTHFELWDLMSLFGPHMSHGDPLLFDAFKLPSPAAGGGEA